MITAEAKSDPGLFTVHRLDEKVYFEIPTAMYDKDMLWQTELAQTGSGAGYGGTHVGERVIRWTRRNNTIYLRAISYAMRGDGKTAIQKSVDAANVSPIIATFPVEAEGANKSAVIEVTRFYAGDGGPVPGSGAIGGGADPSRSYLERIKSFPTNIEARAVVTYSARGGITTTVHHSLVLLPEKPMQGRYFDSRVGYFTDGFEDYGSNENRVKEREFINRYRLEKKDPTAKVSDPVKPIVYYISREVPEKYRFALKQGNEAWSQCFEQAGFSHAIIAKDAPTEQEDPTWDPEDARYSVIRWAAQPIENAVGPHISDPRTGEILSAHVIIWHDVMKLSEQWYFAQVACLDKRAQTLPLPEPLMGELLRYVVTHEVGHTLGLRHNHKASSSYTAAQLRDAAFTEKFGDEASIMDYGRFNYVAQPGDNARLIPIIGPYDRFAIEWGYKPFAGATTPDAERLSLDEIAARQVADPMLRFGGEDANSRVDPTVQMEDLGSDPIEATTYGLKNLERNTHLLLATTTRYGDDYSMLQEMYGQILNQRITELTHVVKLVGGVVQTDYHVGHGAEVYRPVPKEKQAQAVRFLVDNAFSTPRSLMAPDILNRIEFGRRRQSRVEQPDNHPERPAGGKPCSAPDGSRSYGRAHVHGFGTGFRCAERYLVGTGDSFPEDRPLPPQPATGLPENASAASCRGQRLAKRVPPGRHRRAAQPAAKGERRNSENHGYRHAAAPARLQNADRKHPQSQSGIRREQRGRSDILLPPVPAVRRDSARSAKVRLRSAA